MTPTVHREPVHLRLATVYGMTAACLLLAFIAGCATRQQLPTFHEDAAFVYFVGTSSSAASLDEGKRLATAYALSELARYLGVVVSSEMTVERVEGEGGLSLRVQDLSQSQTLEPLVRAVVVDEVHVEKNANDTVDVAVRIRYPKSELEREQVRQEQRARERLLDATQSLETAQKADAAGELLVAVRSYSAAVEATDLLEGAQSTRSAAVQGLMGLIAHLRLSVVGGHEQRVIAPDGMANPFVIRLALLRDGREIPVADCPMSYRVTEGHATVASDLRTDADGRALFRVGGMERASTHVVIDVAPALDEIVRSLSDLSPSSQRILAPVRDAMRTLRAELRFSVQDVLRSDSRLALAVRETVAGESPSSSLVAEALRDALSTAGFRLTMLSEKHDVGYVSPDVGFLLVGEFETVFSSHNEGHIASSHSRGSIRLVSVATGQVLFSKNVDRVRGFGETREKSLEDARLNLASRIAVDVVDELGRRAKP